MENLRCTWNIFSNLSPTLVRIFPLLYNVANKTRGGFHDRKSEKKKVFHLFLGISLKRRLFITYLLLSSLILMLTSVFFILHPKSTDQACRTFQSAAAIPDHQQPWRKDR